MNIDLEDIRAMAAWHPNMRVNTLLHQLEKRRKVEELQRAQCRYYKPENLLNPIEDAMKEPSFWERLMGRSS